MEMKLKVVSGKHAGQEIAIAGPRFMIGRAEDNHLRPSSELISRHHCELLIEGTKASLKDLGSKNGTLVNDQRVEGERVLQTGDRLTIGQLEFEVQLTHQLGGPKRPKVADAKEAAERLRSEAPAGEDADVASWLSDTPTSQAAHDTGQLTMSDTGQFLSDAMPAASETTEAATKTISDVESPAAEAGESTGPDEPSKTPGKAAKPLGKHLPPTSANSRDAAADFLRKMAKYR